MAEPICFYFDPRCPWCYQTSRWVLQLAEAGEVNVTWGLFSLDIANADDPREVDPTTGSSPALRTAAAVRSGHGQAAVGQFYAALGAAIHQRGAAADDHAVITGALREAGLPEELLDKALVDDMTWETVRDDHSTLVERTRSFGVPTIVLDGGEGPAIFGPVISQVPEPADAVQLWRHVSWLTRYENFSELKRERIVEPDLESYRRFMAAQREG